MRAADPLQFTDLEPYAKRVEKAEAKGLTEAIVVGDLTIGKQPCVAAAMGTAVGFLLLNFPPARIYMGDAGSLLLGFVLAGLALRVPGIDSWQKLAVAGFVLGIPLFDTALVWVSRRSARRPFLQGGRDHFAHRLELPLAGGAVLIQHEGRSRPVAPPERHADALAHAGRAEALRPEVVERPPHVGGHGDGDHAVGQSHRPLGGRVLGVLEELGHRPILAAVGGGRPWARRREGNLFGFALRGHL